MTWSSGGGGLLTSSPHPGAFQAEAGELAWRGLGREGERHGGLPAAVSWGALQVGRLGAQWSTVRALLCPSLPLKPPELSVLSFFICEMEAVINSHLAAPFRLK